KCSLPIWQWPLTLGLAHLPLASRGLLAPAMARIVSLSTRGSGEVGRRDTQCHEVLLLDRRQGGDELALALDFEPYHPGKLGRHHEGRRLLRGLLVPPRQRLPRGLYVHAQGALHQTPQQQR